MIITRPQYPNEQDFLNNENLINRTLILKDIDGSVISQIEAPVGGWSHDLLEKLRFDIPVWEAYLGNIWIGSSEV